MGLSTAAIFKPQAPQAQAIVSISRWTCCPCSLSRCWSAMSPQAKRSSISPWLQAMLLWQSEAMPIKRRACFCRLSVRLYHADAHGALSPDHHGAVALSLASEIAIKRWKSVLDVDALRAKANSPVAEVWLPEKLLYAVMLERRMRWEGATSPTSSARTLRRSSATVPPGNTSLRASHALKPYQACMPPYISTFPANSSICPSGMTVSNNGARGIRAAKTRISASAGSNGTGLIRSSTS